MRIVDVADPVRIDKKPDQTLVLFEGSMEQSGYVIQKVELCLYKQYTDEKLGLYSIITCVVYTDKGSIETIYDEGYRGDDALTSSGSFLTQNMGLSGVILRSIITLQNHSDPSHS